MKRRTRDWANTRTFAAEIAEDALADLELLLTFRTDRARGIVRDMLGETFAIGEMQGETRALRILTVALTRAKTDEARAAIREVVQLLAPDVAGTSEARMCYNARTALTARCHAGHNADLPRSALWCLDSHRTGVLSYCHDAGHQEMGRGS